MIRWNKQVVRTVVFRQLGPLALCSVLAGVVAVIAPHAAPASSSEVLPSPVPPEALAALRDGRFLRASLILRDYLAASPDSTPSTVLLAAQAEAGWGDWSRVRALLAGRPWLDSLAAGHGWDLLGRSQLALGAYGEGSVALARYLEAAPDAGPRERGITELRRAVALTHVSEAGAAAEAFDSATALLPQIHDWIALRAADAAAEAGDTAQVSSRLAGIDRAVMRDRVWGIRVRALRNAGDTTAALAIAEWGASSLRGASRRAEAWQLAGEIRLAMADSTAARSDFLHAIRMAPGGAAALDAAERLAGLGGTTIDDDLLLAKVNLRHGNIDRAAAGIGAYLKAGRASAAEAARLHYDLGNAYFRSARYAEAQEEFRHVQRPAATAATAAQALFLLGRAQYRSGHRDQAVHTFLSVPARFPGQSAAAEALYLTADLYQDQGETTRATALYRRTVAVGSDGESAGLARMRLAGLAFQAGQFSKAAQEFESYRKAYPDGRRYDQATYWAARAEMKVGNHDHARSLLKDVRMRDPFSYYGTLAAQLLGEGFWDVRLEASPEPVAGIQSEVEAALANVDLLDELGWDDAAHDELNRVRDRFVNADGGLYDLAEALNARGLTSAGIGLGWTIFRREGAWNPRLLRIVYPFPYRDIILAEARDRGVDPFLAAGLIRQESMFNAGAVSRAGAIGLMQVMPGTGRTVARQVAIDRFDATMLKRPELNLHLGMMFLSDMLQTYGGRLVDVLAAYNAGASRVDRWKQFPEHGSAELFAERIPFAETREYVKIVQQNARMYAALYGTEVSASDRGE